MEAQQCVKLSLTNRPFGLISHPARSGQSPARLTSKLKNITTMRGSYPHNVTSSLVLRFDDPVVMAKAPTPDPIPNSAVKSFSANGTAS